MASGSRRLDRRGVYAGKWEKMFGVKKAKESVEEVKVKKPRKKTATKKSTVKKSTSKTTKKNEKLG